LLFVRIELLEEQRSIGPCLKQRARQTIARRGRSIPKREPFKQLRLKKSRGAKNHDTERSARDEEKWVHVPQRCGIAPQLKMRRFAPIRRGRILRWRMCQSARESAADEILRTVLRAVRDAGCVVDAVFGVAQRQDERSDLRRR